MSKKSSNFARFLYSFAYEKDTLSTIVMHAIVRYG